MALKCLPPNELEDFASGKIESERFELIATHIDSCNRCQETVIAFIEPTDTIVAKLRSAGDPNAVIDDSILESGLKKIIHDAVPRQTTEGESLELPLPAIESVGPYQLEECLGVGGMGTVYKATHSRLKRTVAIKILPAGRWANAAAVTRFHREMEAIGKLDHPNIVRATDAGEHDGMHYLAMDFVDGLNLSQLSKRLGTLPVADACRLIQQAAIGLQYAHENGLIHRDIKPSNIMLSRVLSAGADSMNQPLVKVLDLGLALLGTENLQHDHEFTTVGQLMGTLDYMSPEQGLDSHEIDTRADIYSLGATLFRLLTGRSPLGDEKYNTLMKKMTALATVPAPSIGAIRADLPEELVHVVDRMLSRNPDDRFSSACEVAAALEAFSEDAELGGLLQRALEAPADEAESVIPLYPHPTVTNSEWQNSQVVPATQSDVGNHGSYKRVLLAFSGFAAIVMAIAVYLITDKGELVIRSEEPIHLEIKKGERVIEPRLVVDTKEKKIELRSGEYTVNLIDAPANLTISKNEVTVGRNQNDLVTVTPKSRASWASGLADETDKFATMTYGGRTLLEWRGILDNDLKKDMLSEALTALTPSSTLHNPYEATLDDVFRIARIHGIGDGVDFDTLPLRCKVVIESHDPAKAASRILKEITHGNVRSREFLSFLFNSPSTIESDEKGLIRPLKARIEAQQPAFADALLAVFSRGKKESRSWTLQFVPNLAATVRLNSAQLNRFTQHYVDEVQTGNHGLIEAAFRFVKFNRDGIAPIVDAILSLVASDKVDEYYGRLAIQLAGIYKTVDEPAFAQALIDLYQATKSDIVKLGVLESMQELRKCPEITVPFLTELAKIEKGVRLQMVQGTLASFGVEPTGKKPGSKPVKTKNTKPTGPRYNNWTFDEWYARVNDERTPSMYLSVMTALSKLATTAEEYEKTIDLGFYMFRDIVDVLGENGSYHSELSDEAIRGLMRLPSDLVVARLLVELEKEPTASSRKYVGDLIGGQRTVSNEFYQDFNVELKARKNDVAGKLVALSNSKSSSTQRWALDRLADFCRQRKIDPNSLDGVVQRFRQELQSDDFGRIATAAAFLQGVALTNDGLAEPLIKIISRPFSEYEAAHQYSMQLLLNMNDVGKPIASAVLNVLERASRQSPENQNIHSVLWAALGIVEKMDEETIKIAVPILQKVAKSPHVNSGRSDFERRIAVIINKLATRPAQGPVGKHQHASLTEAANCVVCRIALDSIKNAEGLVENAKIQFESGTSTETNYVSAMVHLLNMKLKYARLQNDDKQALELLKSIVEYNQQRVQHLNLQYTSGEGTIESLLKARQDLNDAKLEYEQEKRKVEQR